MLESIKESIETIQESIKSQLNWRVYITYNEKIDRYVATYKSRKIFEGDKQECIAFLRKHTIQSLVRNEAF